MKTVRALTASLATLLAACLAHAADSKLPARVVAILDVETDDAIGYATWLKQYNEVAKAKLNADSYLRVYQSFFDGQQTGRVRVTTAANNVAEMMKFFSTLENDPAIIANRDHLRGIRKMHSRMLYQAVRFEGANPRGAHNFNTLANVTDEAGYLKALDELRAIFDANGFKDIRISALRVLAGRADHTHRITISTPSAERLAAFLDFTATNSQAKDWIARSAQFRTVVSNSTSREITRY